MRTKDIFRRRLLLLKNDMDWTYQDMADLSGLPISTIKSYVFRGREPGEDENLERTRWQ